MYLIDSNGSIRSVRYGHEIIVHIFKKNKAIILLYYKKPILDIHVKYTYIIHIIKKLMFFKKLLN